VFNKGLGGAYKVGLVASQSEFITWVPADCSHRSDSLLEAYQSIGEADMIIPLPINPEVRSFSRRVISRLFTSIINITSGLNIPYFNGLTVHRTSLLKRIEIKTNSFAFQAEIIVKLIRIGAGYKIVKTFIEERPNGASKAFTFKNISAVVVALFNIRSGKN
jgi:hypothetical protein